MRDELLGYYEGELTFLRRMGAEFAEKYPTVASRLLLDSNRSEDPHVERMIEAFAFLAARVHLKIDDEFPEIIEALHSVLYPHYIRPIPSMSVVQFHVDPGQGKLTSGLSIPRNSILYSRPVDGYSCKFRTCYDTTIWPLTVAQAQWTSPDRPRPSLKAAEAVAALCIELRCFPDVNLDKLELDALRFYLNGEGRLIHALYELLLNNCTQILVRDPTPKSKLNPVPLRLDALRALGFAESEAMLPYSRRSFIAYRLLQEYFSFPEKFFFLELSGLERVWSTGFKERAEIIFLISPFERNDRQQALELGVTEKTFRLGCAPVINLFQQTAEPILVDHTRYEYPVVPDVRRRNATEVFSIDEVLSTNPQSHEIVYYEPFYSYRHGTVREKKQTFWHSTRRPSGKRNDSGTEVYLSLVDLSGRPMRPEFDTVTVRCTCTNRDLPSRLPFGNEGGDFELEGVAGINRIVALKKPTDTLRPPLGKGLLWRLISHLSLNYLSLVEEGKEALQEILKLYNFSDSPSLQKQISGISNLKSSRHFSRVASENGITFARGTRVEIEFDEEQFVGGGVYLFASVLEHFLGLYVSMNSFSQLVARTQQRREALREWPPRAGQSILM